MMEKREIEDLRDKVSCAALLERDGWKLDRKESCRAALNCENAAVWPNSVT